MTPPFHRTRIAPTPSGFLHRGNALSFLLTAALARESGASLLLRIDDMDRERVRPGYIADIFDTLRFLQIEWTEGPGDADEFERTWSQRKRLPLYEAALAQLADKGLVYACTCSRSELLRAHPDGHYTGTCRNKQISLDSPAASWRLRTNETPLSVKLLDGKRQEAKLPPAQRDFIVRRRDRLPAYQLSSLVDDEHFGIDLVVRGEDLWDSTLAQLFLARQLGYMGFENAAFYHHPLLRNGAGEKLSKSAGASSIRNYRGQGGGLEALQSEAKALRINTGQK